MNALREHPSNTLPPMTPRARDDFWNEAVNLREWTETEFGFRLGELQ